jgi:DNA polymerase
MNKLTRVQKEKQKKLDVVAEAIAGCRECKEGKSGLAVPGEGNPDADIMLIGEAPGKTEAREGRPFIGRAGKYLRALLAKNGINSDEVYITSPVKYLPDKVTPSSKDIEHGTTHLLEQIKIINPKMIILMGNTAVKALLGKKFIPIKKHKDITEINNIKYFLTVHPAAAMRFPSAGIIMQTDFKKIKKFLSNSDTGKTPRK